MAIVPELEFGELLSFGEFRLSAAQRLLLRNGAPVAVGGRSLDILIALATRSPQIVSKQELIRLVWPGIVVEEVTNSGSVLRETNRGVSGWVVGVPAVAVGYLVALPFFVIGLPFEFWPHDDERTPAQSPPADPHVDK